MAGNLDAPPVLSTPDTHILSEAEPDEVIKDNESLSDEQIETRYEIRRTITEIKQQRWKRVALQFPDQMLPHSARVFQLLARGLTDHNSGSFSTRAERDGGSSETLETNLTHMSLKNQPEPVKLTILADTSYGSCCVDEIAAEHVNADAVIHYGRACLSPTTRLPVFYVYTRAELKEDEVLESFQNTFPDQAAKIIITADVPYAAHVQSLTSRLDEIGYSNLYPASIIHDPSSSIPNRTVPNTVQQDPLTLKDWYLFHISDPPTSLLLTLTSRMAAIYIYATDRKQTGLAPKAVEASTSMLLRRRYALVTSLSTVPVWGILINTLSVKNYLHMVEHVKSQIAKAGKKSYLFVVGKLNAAKVANFSEIGGWVVIGCWESSLIDSKDFYKPIITPFELEMALKTDDSRIWTGEWRSDFAAVLEAQHPENSSTIGESGDTHNDETNDEAGDINDDSEDDEPPEFDLRTGQYVSRTRPMQSARLRVNQSASTETKASTALTKRANGDIVAVNGVASPAAEFLASKRTWKGLGSDFEVRYDEDGEGDAIEEGRTGVARGYTVGESSRT